METGYERMRSGQMDMPHERGMGFRHSMMGRERMNTKGWRGLMFRLGSWIQRWAERGAQPFYRAGERAQEWAESGQSSAMRMGSRMQDMADPRGRWNRYGHPGQERPMWRERTSMMDYPMSGPDYPEAYYDEMGMEGGYNPGRFYTGYRYTGMGRQRMNRQGMMRGPKNYRRSDERIREDVCEMLSQGYFDARDMEVHVENGEVTLSGSARSREAKRLAEDMADDIGGVMQVHNQLRVHDHERTGERGNGHGAERRMQS